jgi:tRNA (uracil-5-)-methyltransferase
VINVLRVSRSIRRLVYVSCAPTTSFVEDLTRLCRPPQGHRTGARGPPFRLVYAQPVDLFPGSDHVELVALFDRLPREEVEFRTRLQKLRQRRNEAARAAAAPAAPAAPASDAPDVAEAAEEQHE